MRHLRASEVQSFTHGVRKSQAGLIKEARDRRQPHVFLSHSHLDRANLSGTIALLDWLKAPAYLDYNSANKDYASRLAAALQLLGANVWFDAWKIRPGDSIPAEINRGLAEFDIFVLLWSAEAAASNWVKSEMSTALMRMISNDKLRIIPVRIDDSAVPGMISHLHHIELPAGRVPMSVAREMLGVTFEKDVRLAVQAVIDKSGLNVREFWGAGTFVCCPLCGAGAEYLVGVQSDDEDNDRRYAGARCTQCDWEEGSEL